MHEVSARMTGFLECDGFELEKIIFSLYTLFIQAKLLQTVVSHHNAE